MSGKIYEIVISGAWNGARVYKYMYNEIPRSLSEVIVSIENDPEQEGSEVDANLALFRQFSHVDLEDLSRQEKERRVKHQAEELDQGKVSTYFYPHDIAVQIEEIPLL